MAIDPYGVSIVIMAFVLSTLATRITLNLYKELGIEFFKYSAWACISLVLMVSGYIFPAILSSAEYAIIVFGGQVLLASFGLLALAFLIAACENLKQNPNEGVINAGFLISGALIVSRFQLNQYTITWTGTRWLQQYGTNVIGLSIVMFMMLLAVMGPIVFRVWRRIRKSEMYRTESNVLFLGFAILLAFYGIYTIVLNSIGFAISSLGASYFVFLILIAGAAGVLARLLRL
ncbi:MAG: hypothetical protein P1Q69_15705, partial [Candidatus Thorarchaeota archaeon]|nr:hypothetical protein [Candidatus Thorarchaeota archaeon]